MKTMTKKEIAKEIFRLLDRVEELADKAYGAHMAENEKKYKKAA